MSLHFSFPDLHLAFKLWGKKWFGGTSGLCDGGLGDTPLAAGTFDDVGGGVALTGILLRIVAALRGLQIECGTAQQVLLKVMEEMPSKKHVNPGVTAAVQTGQQHGDDKGHCCRGKETALTKQCKEKNTHCIPTK